MTASEDANRRSNVAEELFSLKDGEMTVKFFDTECFIEYECADFYLSTCGMNFEHAFLKVLLYAMYAKLPENVREAEDEFCEMYFVNRKFIDTCLEDWA